MNTRLNAIPPMMMPNHHTITGIEKTTAQMNEIIIPLFAICHASNLYLVNGRNGANSQLTTGFQNFRLSLKIQKYQNGAARYQLPP